MTRDQIQTAVREGIPFLIRMADGQTYTVTDSDEIAFGKTAVVIIDDDIAHVLPLLTMTGLTYLSTQADG